MGAAINVSKLSLQKRKHLLWRAGNLRYLCREHQLGVYKQWHAYNELRQDPEQRRKWRELGAKWPELSCFAIARRWGKTTLALLLAIEAAIQRPNSDGMIVTAFQSSIGSIVLKIIRDVFVPEAPEGYAPVYHHSANGLSEHLEIPATGSRIRLVGLDKNPDKTRGNACDFAVFTELGFMSFDILDTYQSVVVQQLRGRPWAWVLFESSYSAQPDHPFHTDFAADAAIRGAYWERTINDSGLSSEEIEEEVAKCGGPQSAVAQRELFNVHIVDRERAVFPNFNAERCIVPADYPIPQYGFGIVGSDNGFTDDWGLAFLLVDPIKHEVIVQWSYGGAGHLTDEIAQMVREKERELWGTRATLTASQTPKLSLADILKPQQVKAPTRAGLEQLSIDNAELTGLEKVWDAPDGAVTYWDDARQTLRPNPSVRAMDVSPEKLHEFKQRHGLVFVAPQKGKGNMSLQCDNLDSLLHNGIIKILDNEANQKLIRQLRSGRWNERRTDFERSAALSHLDIAVALAIGARLIDWSRNPVRPKHVDPHAAGVLIKNHLREQLLKPYDALRKPSATRTPSVARKPRQAYR